ncbi:hypothetical protein SASPL_113175 [Salvia splendens]|uniref:Uncharacterized protein n=1 Tax=Salvia splendens TaxID=180675 RepID=A0A8X8Y171_SALSN|nr:hypothetical protein SASPL_113175 [Salvia splendens]
MAYNLQPLITILEGILDPHQPRWIVDENNPQLQSLFDKSTSLQKLLDSNSSFTKLDTQIREVTHQTEDIIESHMVHHMLSGSDCVRFTLSTPDLQQVTRHLDSLMEQAEKLLEMEMGDEKMLRDLDSAMEQLKLVDKKMPSSSSSSSKSAVLVGIDEDLMQLQDRLTQAEDWLKALVERNLFMVREYKKNGKPKRYNMHDMLRDVCIRKCDEDKFMNGPNKFTFSNLRRMIFHTSYEMEDVNDSTDSMILTRSVICIYFWSAEFPSDAFFAARLLRVLDLMDMRFDSFQTVIFEFVNLRFLGVKCNSSIPRGISRLWNLQTLIAPKSKFDEPAELWKLSELRHLKVNVIELLKDEAMKYSVLKKLQSTVSVKVSEATRWDGFLKSVPNIKKLDKKWYDQEWELAEEHVFPSLLFLHLELFSLVRWKADETNFPRLRHLRHPVLLWWELIKIGCSSSPHELLGIGQKIGSDCGELPLAIGLIGRLLSMTESSKDKIGNNVIAAVSKSGEQC